MSTTRLPPPAARVETIDMSVGVGTDAPSMEAMRRPSGDQAGDETTLRVSQWTCNGRATETTPRPSLLPITASLLPNGDQTAAEPSATAWHP